MATVETEHIIVSNCTSINAAIAVLNLVVPKDEYGVSGTEFYNVLKALGDIQTRLFKMWASAYESDELLEAVVSNENTNRLWENNPELADRIQKYLDGRF